MQKINDFLSHADIAILKRDFDVIFESAMTDDDFDKAFDKMVAIETDEVQNNDTFENKKLAVISGLITKMTTSEKW
ncbi:hypothetical protein [uncultured Leuconostoc sp.]|uniref:hypothetical protein n=1 Tax=uncultured Leuconostoc sp. TaxID=173262 RepID=UPI0025F20712|nr:hypothetical protein [uncultured Leuconostoc sp.]